MYTSDYAPCDIVGRLHENLADAYALVCEHTQSDSVGKHVLAVETAMRAYARIFVEDGEKLAVLGLLHDFDFHYEHRPNPPDQPLKDAEILTQHDYPEDVIYGIKSHVNYLTDCPPRTLMDKALYACDELAGFAPAKSWSAPKAYAA